MVQEADSVVITVPHTMTSTDCASFELFHELEILQIMSIPGYFTDVQHQTGAFSDSVMQVMGRTNGNKLSTLSKKTYMERKRLRSSMIPLHVGLY